MTHLPRNISSWSLYGLFVGAMFKVVPRIFYIQKFRKTRLYLLGLKLVYCLNVNTSKMQGIINCPINSSKRKQNKSKANIISMNGSEQDEEKVQSVGKFLRNKKGTSGKQNSNSRKQKSTSGK